MNTETETRRPCQRFETACLETALGFGNDPAWAEHRTNCPRCREALAAAEQLVQRCAATREDEPATIAQGLAAAIFERTTRKPSPMIQRRWAWAGVALAAAGAAFLVARRPQPIPPPEALDFADVELELLEDLDLAENLDLLEVLDELEALDRV